MSSEATVSAEKLAQRILDAGLLDPHQLDRVWAEFGTREIPADQLGSALIKRELLTNFQIDRLMKGERGGYFYGDYRILYLIGSGTFARVYRAVHKTTNKVVAVKVLRKRFRDEIAQTEQFLREGEIGSRLRHPNIVPIYEVSRDVKAPYLVLEFVEGQNLREFCKARRKFTPKEAVSLLIDICAGLAYAAEKGMSHRDLKMSNVLVTSRGRAKLVDFGLASVAEHMRDGIADESISARTIDYAGLERASGVRKDDPRSDLFFAGCILYNTLTGVPPLAETRERMQRLSVSRYTDIRPILQVDSTIPKSVVAVVNRAIEFNPEKRYHSAQEMLKELKKVLAKLEKGEGDTDEVEVPTESSDPNASSAPTMSSARIMVVESKADMQDVLRERLKKDGHKVLIISDPVRALARFSDAEPAPADCVIFSASAIGAPALEAFNEFGTLAHTKDIPAILFVDQKQGDFIRVAKLSPKRILLTMPLKVRDLRETLLKILGGPPAASTGDSQSA